MFVALGASSGCYFVSMLASKMGFRSIVMIAEGVFDQIDVGKDYPPTLFVHMRKDKARKRKIGLNVERKESVDVCYFICNKSICLLHNGRIVTFFISYVKWNMVTLSIFLSSHLSTSLKYYPVSTGL